MEIFSGFTFYAWDLMKHDKLANGTVDLMVKFDQPTETNLDICCYTIDIDKYTLDPQGQFQATKNFLTIPNI